MEQPEMSERAVWRRFGPFSMPTDTDFRFLLLIMAVLCASLFIFRWIQSGRDENLSSRAIECIEKFGGHNLESGEELDSANQEFQVCLAGAYQGILIFVSAGVGVVFMLGVVILFLLPVWKKANEKLVFLKNDDDPEVMTYIQGLDQEVDLQPKPTWLWNPLARSASGVAFGRMAKPFVSLSGGLVTLYYLDKESFKSIVLHELAHIKNGDIGKIGFTIAIWYSFIVAALLPLVIERLFFSAGLTRQFIGVTLALGWRLAALVILVYLVRNAVLRAREYYADLRVREWQGSEESMLRLLGTYGDPPESRRLKALHYHPTTQERQDVLAGRRDIYRMGFFEALAAGLAAGIAYPSLDLYFTQLFSKFQGAHLAPIGAALVLAPLIAGVAALGIWRMVLAARDQQKALPAITELAVGLWLGTWIGRNLSIERFIELRQMQGSFSNILAAGFFSLLLSLAWLALVFLYLYWVRDGAAAWSETALSARSIKPFYRAGWISASLILAAIYGPILGLMKFDANPNQMFTRLLVDIAAIPTLVTRSPFTTLVLLLLWVFPLAAYLARWPVRPAQLASAGAGMGQRIKQAAITGLLAGTVYSLALLIVWIYARLAMDAIVWDSAGFKLSFYTGGVAFAILAQCLAALIVSWKSKENGVYLGMLAAFGAALIATAGFLIENLLFGGVLDLQLAWMTFSYIANLGALLILPILIAFEIIRKLMRRNWLTVILISVLVLCITLTCVLIIPQVVEIFQASISGASLGFPGFAPMLPENTSDANATITLAPSVLATQELEKGVLGLWHRLHKADGTDMYLLFNADGSACKWEEPSGSEERQNISNYVSWELDEANPQDVGQYGVILHYANGAESAWIFNAAARQIRPEGGDLLVYTPETEEKVCNP